MEHRLLEYFIAVCEELHFTKAAEKLGISQPTLSQQIRVLEERIGSPLFRRIGKKTHITEAGQLLLHHSRRIFHELDQATTAISELQGIQRGSLRIGCSGNHLLTASVIAFHQRYPGIEMSVLELATEETKDRLLHNLLDIGVVFLPLQDEQLESIPLFEEELCLVVSADHPFALLPQVELRLLQEVPLVLLPRKFHVRQMIDRYCREAGFLPKPTVEMSTLDSLLHMSSLGVGAAVLPGSFAKQADTSRVRFLRIANPTPHQTIGIVYRKDAYLSATMDAFMRQLIQHFLPDRGAQRQRKDR